MFVPHRRSPSGDARRVLLVEDDVDAQVVTSSALRRSGYEVLAVDSVAGARRVMRDHEVDLVLLDCRLPDGDGLELARAWRTDASTRAVPVVVLTAFSARQDVEAALLAGADAFLVKPVPPAVLVAEIRRVLAGPRPSHRFRAPRP